MWLRVRADLCFLPPPSSLHFTAISHRFGSALPVFSDTYLVNLLVFFIFKQYPVGNLSTLSIPTWWFCISLLMFEWVFLCFEGVLCVSVLAPLVPVIGQRAVLGLSGFVINNIAFVFVAVYLYRWFGCIFLNSIWLSKSLLGLKLFGSFNFFFPYNN